MVKGKLRKPKLMLINILRWWKVLGLAAGLVLILGAFLIRVNASLHVFASDQAIHANHSTVDSSIKVQFETIQPDGSGENYFVNYRLKRNEFRQETKAMLSELLNSSVDKTKIQADEKWLELTSKIQKEDEIENLLKIRGFKDLVTDVYPDNVTVIVYSQGLTPNEVNIIQDIVVRVTKVRLDKIMISVKQ
jgi:stage III sporulation protein AH